MTSTTKTPKLKPKPPPLTLHPNPHNWLLNPLAEFAAIATSPQSPLVQQTTCGGGVYDVTSRDQDSTSLSSLVIISRAMFGQVKRGMSSLKHAFLFPNFRLHWLPARFYFRAAKIRICHQVEIHHVPCPRRYGNVWRTALRCLWTTFSTEEIALVFPEK